VRELVAAGVSPHVDEFLPSPIETAIACQNLPMLRLLMELGVPLYKVGDDGAIACTGSRIQRHAAVEGAP
jgi:hypothetical protein